jgi:hypothetical protein
MKAISQAKNEQRITYGYDLHDPIDYFNDLASNTSTAASIQSQYLKKWYNNSDYVNKLIYKTEGNIPAIVQKILEEMGFIEWDETNDEDHWNILWKN